MWLEKASISSMQFKRRLVMMHMIEGFVRQNSKGCFLAPKRSNFIICKTDDQSPVVTIELDDKTHNQKHRQKRDELLKRIYKQTRLPMLQVPAQWAYKTEVLKITLVKVLSLGLNMVQDDTELIKE